MTAQAAYLGIMKRMPGGGVALGWVALGWVALGWAARGHTA
jgi:hypothetical protein